MSLAYKRLSIEYLNLQREPLEFIQVAPQESNILIWHFILNGAKGTPYENGQYYGKMVFSTKYPHKAPTLRVITPSGRFSPGAIICIKQIEERHWNPNWTVSSILVGLMAFMEVESNGVGSCVRTYNRRKALALDSRKFNNAMADFKLHFPEIHLLNEKFLLELESELEKKKTTTNTQSKSTGKTEKKAIRKRDLIKLFFRKIDQALCSVNL